MAVQFFVQFFVQEKFMAVQFFVYGCPILRLVYGCPILRPILLLEQRNSGRQGKKVERLPSDHDSFAW